MVFDAASNHETLTQCNKSQGMIGYQPLGDEETFLVNAALQTCEDVNDEKPWLLTLDLPITPAGDDTNQ